MSGSSRWKPPMHPLESSVKDLKHAHDSLGSEKERNRKRDDSDNHAFIENSNGRGDFEESRIRERNRGGERGDGRGYGPGGGRHDDRFESNERSRDRWRRPDGLSHDEKRGNRDRNRERYADDDYYRYRPRSRNEGDIDVNRKYNRMLDKDRGREVESNQKLKRNKVSRHDESWCPPPFEESGASYILDARSGMFYEQHSDFFYDPKSKLYYGNKQKAYFSFCAGEKPRFRRVGSLPNHDSTKNVIGLTNDTAPDSERINATESHGDQKDHVISTHDKEVKRVKKSASTTLGSKTAKKSLVTISIGAKCLGKKSDGKPIFVEQVYSNKKPVENLPDNALAVTSSADQKKHSADMEKWLFRGREKMQSILNSEPELLMSSGTEVRNGIDPLVSASNTKCLQEPAVIGKGTPSLTGRKPVCLLCKRKFASLEKLSQHEKISSLHKENLAKKALAVKSKKEASAEYRDRAKDRRYLYEPDTSSITKSVNDTIPGNVTNSSVMKARIITTTEAVSPSENLGDANIGNQLLQKLGWNGGNLGRKVSTATNDLSGEESASSKLKGDWEAIEKMAAGNSGHRSGSRDLGYGAGYTGKYA